jgi:hypothetical protein
VQWILVKGPTENRRKSVLGCCFEAVSGLRVQNRIRSVYIFSLLFQVKHISNLFFLIENDKLSVDSRKKKIEAAHLSG